MVGMTGFSPKRCRQNGITLIEVLVSMVVLVTSVNFKSGGGISCAHCKC